jgi:hypothetical protein
MLGEDPTAGPEGIRSALWGSAAPVGSFGSCAVGAGLVDAVSAIQNLLSPGPTTAPDCTPPVSRPWPADGEGGEGSGEGAPAPEAGAQSYSPAAPRVAGRRALRTFFRWHPRRVIRTRHRRARAVFWFGANAKDVTFICRVDRGLFRRCKRRYARRFRVGRHVLRVMARDAAGNFDRTPAVYRFRVKRRRP